MKKLLIFGTVLLLTGCNVPGKQEIEQAYKESEYINSDGSPVLANTITDKVTGCQYIAIYNTRQQSRGGAIRTYTVGIVPRLNPDGKPLCRKARQP